MRGHDSRRPGKGKKWMSQGPQGGPIWLREKERPGICIHLGNPESCSGTHPPTLKLSPWLGECSGLLRETAWRSAMSNPTRVFPVPKLMPRLLFDLFVSVLKMWVFPLNSLSANVIFQVLGGRDVGQTKPKRKKKMKDKTERRDMRQADGIWQKVAQERVVVCQGRKRMGFWAGPTKVQGPEAPLAKHMVLGERGGHSVSLTFNFPVCRMWITITSLQDGYMD